MDGSKEQGALLSFSGKGNGKTNPKSITNRTAGNERCIYDELRRLINRGMT